jgi:hypothetical protein
MGRGRAFAGHKIVPPSGARWAPKPSAHARCVGRQLIGQTGGKAAGVRARFSTASAACHANPKLGLQ